jgi:hypothetical protein
MAEVKKTSGGVTFDLRTIPPLKEFEFHVKRFTARVSDFSHYFEGLGIWFRARMGEQFGTEGRASGGK